MIDLKFRGLSVCLLVAVSQMKALLVKQCLEELVALRNQPDAWIRDKIRNDLLFFRDRFVIDRDNHTRGILTIEIFIATNWQRPIPIHAFNLHRVRCYKVGAGSLRFLGVRKSLYQRLTFLCR